MIIVVNFLTTNTTPCLVLRFEAKDNTALIEIQEKFKQWLQSCEIPANAL